MKLGHAQDSRRASDRDPASCGQLNSSSAAHTGSDHKRRDDDRGQQPTTNKQDKNCRLRDLPEIVHSASFNGALL